MFMLSLLWYSMILHFVRPQILRLINIAKVQYSLGCFFYQPAHPHGERDSIKRIKVFFFFFFFFESVEFLFYETLPVTKSPIRN